MARPRLTSVELTEIQFRHTPGAFDHDHVKSRRKVGVRLQHFLEQEVEVFIVSARRKGLPDFSMDDHLTAAVRIRLEQDRIHGEFRLQSAGPRLGRLRTANLSSHAARVGVVGHVLGFEWRYPQTTSPKPGTDCSDHPTLPACEEVPPMKIGLAILKPPPHDSYQVRSADHRHDGRRQAFGGRQHDASDGVAGGQQHAPQQERARQKKAIIGTDSRSHQMRNDQAYKPGSVRSGDRSRSEHRAAHIAGEHHALQIDAAGRAQVSNRDEVPGTSLTQQDGAGQRHRDGEDAECGV